jgi:NAD(P)-dependent dehydrogenase (short-subunit alcohol dehydrogenase family)
MTDPGRFAGKTALVTGAAKGMGRSIAEAFLDQGAQVMLFDRDRLTLDATAEGLGRLGRVLAVDGDVSVRAEVADAFRLCVDRLGGLDVVVAQAGIGDLRPFLEIDDHAWERMIAVNLNGVFYTVQEAARIFSGLGRSGAIVVTSSTNAFFPERHTVHYSAAKGATVAFVRACALDLAELGVRINSISPGIVRTPLAAPIVEDPVAAADYLAKVPLGRFGEPEEIARLVLFLASDDASYITGENIVIDGGASVGTILRIPEGALSAVDPPAAQERVSPSPTVPELPHEAPSEVG